VSINESQPTELSGKDEMAQYFVSLTEDEKARFFLLMGRKFDNSEQGYKLEGQSGTFRLHMVGERCDMIWTRSDKRFRPAEPGETMGFQINTESLFDLALLSRELTDLVEQAIAVEIRRQQEDKAV